MTFDAKQKKAATKEGAKKGQDCQGLNALGGVKFFALAMQDCEGSQELLKLAMEGANQEVDDAAEERKGGAGDLGKLFMSAGDKSVEIYAHVPLELKDTVNVKEWVESVLAVIGGSIIEASDEYVTASAPGNADSGKFPLKMRDEGVNASFTFLKNKKLIADDDSDSDVDYSALHDAAGWE